MLEVILSGGLGNQLFQYAFGRYLSHQRNEQLVLNTYRLSMSKANETARDFYLGSLNLKADIINKKRIVGLNRPLDFVLRTGLFPFYSYESSDMDKSIFFGYWLNAKFPDAVRSNLLTELTYIGSTSESLEKYLEILRTKKVLAVHVRRGDYVTNLKAKSVHGVLGLEYYKNALSSALKLCAFDDVFIFSDDPAWCKAQFPAYTIVEPFKEGPFLDLFLMSQCHSNVIANSTFSWWSAWLNQNPDKLTFAPTKWFISLPNPPIYGEKWLTIE